MAVKNLSIKHGLLAKTGNLEEDRRKRNAYARDLYRNSGAQKKRRYYKAHKDEICKERKLQYRKHRGRLREEARQRYRLHRMAIGLRNKRYAKSHRKEKRLYNQKYHRTHRKLIALQARRYYRTHIDRIRQRKKVYALRPEVVARAKVYAREWRVRNIERVRVMQKRYVKEHIAHLRDLANRWHRKQWRTNDQYRLKRKIKLAIRQSLLQGGCVMKPFPVLGLLGCSLPFLRSYLEKRFASGMTWGNWGSAWHIDHIRPCASFNLQDPVQQKQCFHYTNLRPLHAMDNFKKSSLWRGKRWQLGKAINSWLMND